MDIDRLSELVKNPEKANQTDLPQLRLLLSEFPYFQAAHLLVANITKNSQEIKTAAAYTANRLILKKIIQETFDTEVNLPSISHLSFDDAGFNALDVLKAPENPASTEGDPAQKADAETDLPSLPQTDEDDFFGTTDETPDFQTDIPENSAEDVNFPPVFSPESEGFTESETDKTTASTADFSEHTDHPLSETAENESPDFLADTPTTSTSSPEPSATENANPEAEKNEDFLFKNTTFEEPDYDYNAAIEEEAFLSDTYDFSRAEEDLEKTASYDELMENLEELRRIRQDHPEHFAIRENEQANAQENERENQTESEPENTKANAVAEVRPELTQEEKSLENTTSFSDTERENKAEITPKPNIESEENSINENSLPQEEKTNTPPQIKTTDPPTIYTTKKTEDMPLEFKNFTKQTAHKPIQKFAMDELILPQTDSAVEQGKQQPEHALHSNFALDALLENTPLRPRSTPPTKPAPTVPKPKEQRTQEEIIRTFIKNEQKITKNRTKLSIQDIKKTEYLSEEYEEDTFNPAVSENLAEILSRQGNFKKAIEIYETLVLKYPEKSAYFAAKIHLLKDRAE